MHDAQSNSQTRVTQSPAKIKVASQPGHAKRALFFVTTKKCINFWWPTCEARIVYNCRKASRVCMVVKLPVLASEVLCWCEATGVHAVG